MTREEALDTCGRVPYRGSALPVSAGDSGQIRGKRAVRPEVDVIELQTIELFFFVSMSYIFPSPFSLTLWCPVAGSGERRAMRQDDAYACNTY